jgi:ABC-type Fe3+-hydroxamate transport system substrate-binding protein
MPATIFSTDQLGDRIEIPFPPQRIISLVPSQTELLFDLGLEDRIVGLTRFCVHPAEKVELKEKIGGTKRFNLEKIHSLEADLLIGNKEENYREGIDELKKHCPVWMSNIFTLADAYAMMSEVANITNVREKGEEVVAAIQSEFKDWQPVSNNRTVAYFIWRKPYMVAAANTFIDYMLGLCGMKNIFSHLQRYPEIQPGSLNGLKPDFIFLSSEPYRFTEKHFDEFQSYSPGSKIAVVDGEIFSWYGSRLRLAPAYFRKLREELAMR